MANGGYLGQAVSKPSTESSEAVGLAAAIIILLFTFGTATAMALPIATAIVGLVTGLAAIGLLGHGIDVPTVGPTLGTMLGLGVGSTTRCSSSRATAASWSRAIRSTRPQPARSATAGGAVVFAGGTVVIALCSLAVAQIPIVSALGYSAAIVVADRGDHGDHPAAGAAGDPRQADRLPCGFPSCGRPPTITARTAGRGGRAASGKRPLPAMLARRRRSCSCWRSRC